MEQALTLQTDDQAGAAQRDLSIVYLRDALIAPVLDQARTHPQPHDARKAIVAYLTDVLTKERAHAEQILLERKSGLDCVSYLSQVMDAIIAAVFEAAVQVFYPAENPTTAEQIAVAAVGGYGRGTLAPGSDIDLLFLLPYKTTPWSESVIEIILYTLWDLKLKVGHSTRSVEDCIREGRADMTHPHSIAGGAVSDRTTQSL